jgi:hypothetical protein
MNGVDVGMVQCHVSTCVVLNNCPQESENRFPPSVALRAAHRAPPLRNPLPRPHSLVKGVRASPSSARHHAVCSLTTGATPSIGSVRTVLPPPDDTDTRRWPRLDRYRLSHPRSPSKYQKTADHPPASVPSVQLHYTRTAAQLLVREDHIESSSGG